MKIENQILYLRVKAIKSHLPQIFLGISIIPPLTYFSLNDSYKNYWISLYLIGAPFFLFRIWKLNASIKEQSTIEELKRYVFAWATQSYFFSILWAILPWLPAQDDHTSIALCGIIIAGVVSGTTLYSISFPHISRTYAIVVLTSFLVRLVSIDHPQFQPLAIMSGLFLILILKMQKTLYGYFLQTFETMLELDEANQKIQETQAAAILSSKLAAQAEMTANLAHEINNPLAIIHLKIDYLLRSKLKGKMTNEMVEEICHKSIEMIHRIQEIIESTKKYFYNDQDGEYDSEVELRELIDEISGIYREKCHRRGIQFEQSNTADVTVTGSRTAVLQVVTNLLNNAFDAVKDQKAPSIKLTVSTKDSAVFVQVQDSGDGISSEVRQKIFEPFYTTKGKGAGLGIGLSICLGLARDMGGDLWLEPTTPTTFCFSMKRKQTKSKVA